MYETLKPFFPNGPTNRTDPIVRHESPYEAEAIATFNTPEYKLDENGVVGQTVDPTKSDAIMYPLIKFNNHILDSSQIIKLTLHNDRFMPYIDLIFWDEYNTIEFGDMPGLNNVVTVIIFENRPEAHKPIKMNFYVTSCDVEDRTFYIQGEFKCLPLEKENFKQEVFHWPSPGCPAKWCQLGPNNHPTTYEFLHVIAENCGLGFSATQKTKEIKDDRWRILKRQKYKDVAQTATACGGIDENNMFDSWIDPWGYLVMANVSWLMKEKTPPDELASQVTTGVETAEGYTESTKIEVGWVHRILSNMSQVEGMNNMMIKEFRKLVDLDTGYYNGTLSDYHTLFAEGPDKNGKNTLNLQQIQETEKSWPGKKTDEYEFHSTEFSGVEMAELTQTIEQRRRHDEYFKKLRTNMFKVTLSEVNFGFERGMLTYILWWTNDEMQKAGIKQWEGNIPEQVEEPGKLKPEGSWEGIINEHETMIDPSVTGTYYIDGTDFEWDQDEGKIVQHLYLIRKEDNDFSQFYNKEWPIRLQRK